MTAESELYEALMIHGFDVTTLKTGSQSASIVTNTDIWQRNVGQRKKNRTHELVSNATRRGILPRTVKRNRR